MKLVNLDFRFLVESRFKLIVNSTIKAFNDRGKTNKCNLNELMEHINEFISSFSQMYLNDDIFNCYNYQGEEIADIFKIFWDASYCEVDEDDELKDIMMDEDGIVDKAYTYLKDEGNLNNYDIEDYFEDNQISIRCIDSESECEIYCSCIQEVLDEYVNGDVYIFLVDTVLIDYTFDLKKYKLKFTNGKVSDKERFILFRKYLELGFKIIYPESDILTMKYDTDKLSAVIVKKEYDYGMAVNRRNKNRLSFIEKCLEVVKFKIIEELLGVGSGA